jgi:hypothetical protein
MFTNSNSRSERLLFWLAIRLAGLVIWAADRLDRNHAATLIAARLTLEFVSMVGWIVDRLAAGLFTAPAPTNGSHHGAHGHRAMNPS